MASIVKRRGRFCVVYLYTDAKGKGEMNPMENTNKMKNLTNDLKAFEQMMKEQRKENRYPEIEFEIDT